MDLQERINLMVHLGEYLQSDDDILKEIKCKAEIQNAWFTQEFIEMAITNIANEFLNRPKLEAWTAKYPTLTNMADSKTVGIVMAGNIPLVGFHDMLCVFLSGHQAVIKTSTKDEVLLKHLVQKMYEWNITVQNQISFADNLKGCDAYIATGSNNSGRYFEYYFGKYPHIIRRNRTSVAILTGKETNEELDLLANDIQFYFGLGCRNVTKILVPVGYDFKPLLAACSKFGHFMDMYKYKDNFDYHLTLLLMNLKYYMSNESLILTENKSVFSPVSQVHYEFYTDIKEIEQYLPVAEEVQCIVGHGYTDFGKAQIPSLFDYADGIDTMEFLSNINTH